MKFAEEAKEFKAIGEAYLPVLALGYRPPECPMEAAYMVAAKVIDYRMGKRPKSVQERLTEMMNRSIRRHR